MGRSGNIHEVLIFVKFARRTNSKFRYLAKIIIMSATYHRNR